MRPRDKLNPPTRKTRAVTRPSPPLRHDEPASKQLRMIFNERRVVAPAFRGRRFADRPHGTAGNSCNCCEAGVRPRPEARARNQRPHAVLTLQDERIVIARRRSEEHTSELQSLRHLVCRLLLEKKKKTSKT